MQRSQLLPIGQVVLYWPGYNPADALDWLSAPHIAAEQVTLSKTAQLPFPPSTMLDDVANWMDENAIQIMSYHLAGSRQRGRWEGRYRILLGKGRK